MAPFCRGSGKFGSVKSRAAAAYIGESAQVVSFRLVRAFVQITAKARFLEISGTTEEFGWNAERDPPFKNIAVELQRTYLPSDFRMYSFPETLCDCSLSGLVCREQKTAAAISKLEISRSHPWKYRSVRRNCLPSLPLSSHISARKHSGGS